MAGRLLLTPLRLFTKKFRYDRLNSQSIYLAESSRFTEENRPFIKRAIAKNCWGECVQ